MPRQSTDLTTKIVNGLLAIDPLANALKHQARTMMIKRAETLGVYWHQSADRLRWRDHDSNPSVIRSDRSRGNANGATLAPEWQDTLAAVENSDLAYPDYYLKPFHAYAEGNLGWQPALEVEVAAQAVHARIWPEAGAAGDHRLRESYHQVLQQELPTAPKTIVDLGCSVGMSTFTLQDCFPEASLTGVDLSPYFLAVAQYRSEQHQAQHPSRSPVQWVRAAAESTGLPAQSFDLVSACLMFHELPQSAAKAILQEARRLVKPEGHVAIMDMNPQSETFAKMPPFVFTLLKSTEPYLDEYLTLDVEESFQEAGFSVPRCFANSPRHRTLIATVK